MKNALLICFVMIWSVITFAQQGLQVGVEGGPQTTWLINKNDSNDPNVKYREGGPRGFLGATIDYHFTPTCGVGLEFLGSWQGQAYSDPYGVNYNYNVNYFKIPLLLNFNSDPSHVAMFVGKFGPYLGLNTTARAKVAGIDTSAILTPNYEAINVGMILDLGIGFNIAKVVVITVSVRLDGQLSDAMIHNPDPTYFSYYDPNVPGMEDAVRDRTWNVAGAIALGVKYIIPVGKHSGYRR